MSDKLFIFTLAIFAIATIVIELHANQGRVIVYDCRISEISPDFPPEVKEQCRKLKAESGRI